MSITVDPPQHDEAVSAHAEAGGSRSEADRRLLERYHRSGERRHRDELVAHFMPLAHNLARRYSRDAASLEDLTQVAAVGLINAVDRFDPARGMAFSSFAVPTIAGEIKRYFRDRTWAVRPPRGLQERVLRTETAMKTFTAENNRSPTVGELAACLGMSQEDVLEGLHARRGASAASLDAPAGCEDEGGGTIGDSIGCDDDSFHRAEQRVLLDDLLRTISPREQAIVRMRFDDDMTQAEIGEAIGLSQMQISRILRHSVERMSIAAGAQQAA